MNKRLQHLFTLLENDRSDLLAKISLLTPEQFNHAPSGKWSVHQVLAHLITAEKLTLQYMQKKVLGIDDAENSGLKEAIKIALLWLSQRLPFRFRAPRVVVEKTPVYGTIEELINDWKNERRLLNAFLETFKDDQLRKKIYKHVRAGKLNIRHGLIFTREHLLHHLPQIYRLLP